MKHVARACVVLALFTWGCSVYDLEGLALVSPVDAIVVGDSVDLSVVAPDGSMPAAASVAWSSSETGIATVDEVGVVRGAGPGWTLIEARTADYTLQIPLLVWATAPRFTTIDGGADHSCGLAEDGRAWCWGSNQFGQLGTSVSPDGCQVTAQELIGCSRGAIPVASEASFTDLAVGFYHSCALSTGGTVHCWGLNDRGELGDGGTEIRPTAGPVAGDHVFKSITAGGRTTCGIRVDDALLCWGDGLFPVVGSSGDGLLTPTHVAVGESFALAATSGAHTCGVAQTGSTWCWGSHAEGQLGVVSVDSTCASAACTRNPQEVTSAPVFVDLALSGSASCGLTSGGAAWCWGGNGDGQLGDGTRTGRWEPMPVLGGHVFSNIEAESGRACGLDDVDVMRCWGRGSAGFGNGGEAVTVDLPTAAGGGLAVSTFSIGFDTQCGVALSGVTWCWGANPEGAIGNGRSQSFPLLSTPERVIRHPAAG